MILKVNVLSLLTRNGWYTCSNPGTHPPHSWITQWKLESFSWQLGSLKIWHEEDHKRWLCAVNSGQHGWGPVWRHAVHDIPDVLPPHLLWNINWVGAFGRIHQPKKYLRLREGTDFIRENCETKSLDACRGALSFTKPVTIELIPRELSYVTLVIPGMAWLAGRVWRQPSAWKASLGRSGNEKSQSVTHEKVSALY